MAGRKGGDRPLFPRGKFAALPAMESREASLARHRQEQAIRAGDERTIAAWEREQLLFTSVQDAFYEGVMAGLDLSWFADERTPDDYWLESDARRNLFAGPPAPEDPHLRAAMMLAMGRRVFGYDPQRDPGRVLADERPRPRKGDGKRRR